MRGGPEHRGPSYDQALLPHLLRWQPLAFLFLLTGGCATLFSASSQTVSFQSEPQGVGLYVNGKYVGETPVEIEVDRDTFKSRVVMLKKEGYQTKQFNLAKTINSVALFNLTSMTPWTTDAVSGNMIEYSPNAYFIEMEAKGALSGHMEGAALLKRFVLYNYDNVLSGIAEGGGDYMVALMELLEVPHEKRGHFIHALQKRMSKLVENRSPLEVIYAIEQEAGDYS